MTIWNKVYDSAAALKPINEKQFWCDWCRKFYPQNNYGKHFENGPTICEWCAEKD